MAVFELDSPYKEVWKRAYLRTCKDGRKRLDLVNNSLDRTTVSYARYLLAVQHGRFLTEYEEADHIDTDETNDDIGNLQILSVQNHISKSSLERNGRKLNRVVCDYCAKLFDVPNWKFVSRKRFLCSRSCNAKFNRENSTWTSTNSKLTLEQKEVISILLDGDNTCYAVSKLTGINRGSIYHYKQNHYQPKETNATKRK